MGRAEDILEDIKKNGEEAINIFISTKKSEELFLDFKRSANNGTGKALDHKDREQLARAISGFGNSEGGLIIWGIDCSEDNDYADVAHTRYPLEDANKFLSWIEGAISSCTIPPHSGVRSFAISGTGQGKTGYVVTYIPKSNTAPHQVVLNGKYQYHYYIRTGSSFMPTPHSVLAGMFGRRPQPDVFHMYTIGPAKLDGNKILLEMGLLINNKGPGIASDLYINATIHSFIGENCQLEFNPTSLDNWNGQFAFGRFLHLISKKDVRLAPGAFFQPVTLKGIICPPFQDDFKIIIDCGSGQSPPYKAILHSEKNQISTSYKEFINRAENSTLMEQDRHNIVKKILGAKENITRDTAE